MLYPGLPLWSLAIASLAALIVTVDLLFRKRELNGLPDGEVIPTLVKTEGRPAVNCAT